MQITTNVEVFVVLLQFEWNINISDQKKSNNFDIVILCITSAVCGYPIAYSLSQCAWFLVWMSLWGVDGVDMNCQAVPPTGSGIQVQLPPSIYKAPHVCNAIFRLQPMAKSLHHWNKTKNNCWKILWFSTSHPR